MMTNPEKINNDPLATLKGGLEEAGIDTSKWGIGNAKTLEHLLKEIQEGESVLNKNENGEYLREVVVADSEIYYNSPDGKVYRLKEEKQVFKDGRERRRNLNGSVSEKMKSGEVPFDAILRGVREELGITGNIELMDNGVEDIVLDSPSYPGLKMRKVVYKFKINLTSEQFNPEGYIEKQEDKDTYFVWEAK